MMIFVSSKRTITISACFPDQSFRLGYIADKHAFMINVCLRYSG